MRSTIPFQRTLTIETIAGWKTVPLTSVVPPLVGVELDLDIEEVYATSVAGATLDVLAVGRVAEFSDTTPPQKCGFFARTVVIAAGAVGADPGLSVLEVNGISAGKEGAQAIGVKGTGVETFTLTVKGRVPA